MSKSMFYVGEKIRIKNGLEDYPNLHPGLIDDIIEQGGKEYEIYEIDERSDAIYVRLRSSPYTYREEWLAPIEPAVEIDTNGLMELFEDG